jgi:hypothetical protein
MKRKLPLRFTDEELVAVMVTARKVPPSERGRFLEVIAARTRRGQSIIGAATDLIADHGAKEMRLIPRRRRTPVPITSRHTPVAVGARRLIVRRIVRISERLHGRRGR